MEKLLKENWPQSLQWHRPFSSRLCRRMTVRLCCTCWMSWCFVLAFPFCRRRYTESVRALRWALSFELSRMFATSCGTFSRPSWFETIERTEWPRNLMLRVSFNEICLQTNLNGHVEWYGNDSIKDNGIGEKHKHSDDGGSLNVLWNDDSLPRQIRLKVVANQTFPERCSNRAAAANR